MKFRQEFRVSEPVPTVWLSFAQPARVAACIPGVEMIDVLEDGAMMVRLTQHLGPMAATFETRVRVTEQVHENRMQFTSTGKAVRGAVGSFRATNTVYLQPSEGGTLVIVEGEAALAGMLGAVAQKIILKQADKMTAEFAANLERLLSGAEPAVAIPLGTVPPSAANTPRLSVAARQAPREQDIQEQLRACLRWALVSATLSGAAALVALLVLWRVVSHP